MAITTDAACRNEGLVWLDPARATLPGTHVLIVGVGQFHANSGLSGLSSPLQTARRLADWFLVSGGFSNADRPLAGLTLLLSPEEGKQTAEYGGGPVPRPIFAAVENAVKGLVTRAAANPGNALVIYMGSHGVGAGDRSGILFEDFGADPLKKRAGMTDTDQLAYSLRLIPNSDKLVIFDCCRNDIGRFSPGEEMGEPLIDPLGDGTLSLPATVLRATLPGAQAYGHDGGPTFLGEGLLAALDGLAAQRNAYWRINTARLTETVGKLLQLRTRDGKPLQVPPSENPTDFAICTGRKTDRLTLYVTVAPDIAEPGWTVGYTDVAEGAERVFGPEWPGAGHARLEVASRVEYQLQVMGPGSVPLGSQVVDMDGPVAFVTIPDPLAQTGLAVVPGAAAGAGSANLSRATGEAALGMVRVTPLPPGEDRMVSTGAAEAAAALPPPPISLGRSGQARVSPGWQRVTMTRLDGQVFEREVNLSADHDLQLSLPGAPSPHEWLQPAVRAGILVPGVAAGPDAPPDLAAVTLRTADDARLLADGAAAAGTPPEGGFETMGGDGRFVRLRAQGVTAWLPNPGRSDEAPVWVEARGAGWREVAFVPSFGSSGWDSEVLVDTIPPHGSRLIPHTTDPQWTPLLAFLGRRDFPNMAEALAELGEGTIRDAVWGKRSNPLAAAAGVLSAVACGPIEKAGLDEKWLRNLTEWFPGLPDGPVALARHLQRERRMDAAREAYALALSRGIPVFSLAVDWLAEGLGALRAPGRDEALRWSRMADSLRGFTVLRLGVE